MTDDRKPGQRREPQLSPLDLRPGHDLGRRPASPQHGDEHGLKQGAEQRPEQAPEHDSPEHDGPVSGNVHSAEGGAVGGRPVAPNPAQGRDFRPLRSRLGAQPQDFSSAAPPAAAPPAAPAAASLGPGSGRREAPSLAPAQRNTPPLARPPAPTHFKQDVTTQHAGNPPSDLAPPAAPMPLSSRPQGGADPRLGAPTAQRQSHTPAQPHAPAQPYLQSPAPALSAPQSHQLNQPPQPPPHLQSQPTAPQIAPQHMPASAPPIPPAAPASLPPKRGKRRGFSVMRGLGYVALGLLCLVLALGTFLVIADPADLIRDQLVSRVKAQTGRDLTIAGETRFTVFPSIGISMSDVTLSPPPGMKGKPTVKMAQLTTSLKLLPLLQRRIIVESLILAKPIVNLHVDFKGRKSWDFAATPASKPLPIRYAQARPKGQLNDAAPGGALPPVLRDFIDGSTDTAAARSPLAMLAGLSLEDVRIDNGTLHYADDRAGTRQTLKAVNLKVSLADIVSPLRAKGDLNWSGETITFNTKLKSLKALLSERPTNFSTQISMRHLKAQYTGGITMGAVLDLDGKLSAKSPSVRKLARWLGVKLPASAGFGPLDLNGTLNMRGNRIELFRTKLHFDGATANGDVGIVTGGRRPKINAKLNLSVLDLNKYIPYDGAAAGKKGKGAGKRAGKTGIMKRAKKGAANIEDLLNRAAGGTPQVRGFTKRAKPGWSNARIDASGLNLVDADVTFNVGKILFKQIKIGDTRLKAKLVKGKLVADLRDMQLYNGEGSATLTLRPKRGGVSLSANMRLNNISALPLLRDAAQFERIDGRGTLNLLVSSEGRSQKAIVAALLGNGRFAFTDGAIVGFNVPKLIRGLQRGQIGDLNGGKAERTDFSELNGTFQITKGIAKNTDLRLLSPLLRMNGAGTVSLVPRTLNYTVKPKIVASLAGQGSNSPLAGLEIPIRIVGSWDKPKVKADFAALTANPQQTLKTIEKIGRSLRGKKGKKLLNDLLGGGKGGKSKAKDLLNQLFR